MKSTLLLICVSYASAAIFKSQQLQHHSHMQRHDRSRHSVHIPNHIVLDEEADPYKVSDQDNQDGENVGELGPRALRTMVVMKTVTKGGGNSKPTPVRSPIKNKTPASFGGKGPAAKPKINQRPMMSRKHEIPKFVRAFYQKQLAGTCPSKNLLKDGFRNMVDTRPEINYCATDNRDVIFLTGPPGVLANMDVDCDGHADDPHDRRCASSLDSQSITSFVSKVREVSQHGVRDLNPYHVPYIVFGNDEHRIFHPEQYGVKPLSVMAVVCGEKLLYGIWGDTCGVDPALVGEAAISIATECFGDQINGNSGHDQGDVLYLAFTGDEAVPGESANWKAQSFDEFEDSISDLGNRLIQRLTHA